MEPDSGESSLKFINALTHKPILPIFRSQVKLGFCLTCLKLHLVDSSLPEVNVDIIDP